MNRRTARTVASAGLAAALLGAVAGPAHAQRMDAEIDCVPTGTPLEFHCRISLMNLPDQTPVEGARFVVRADMPTMPMAHNVPPVTAAPTDEAGVYEATLELEMFGEWALRLDIAEPRRDMVVVVRDFEESAGDHGRDHDHGDMPEEHGHGHDHQN